MARTPPAPCCPAPLADAACYRPPGIFRLPAGRRAELCGALFRSCAFAGRHSGHSISFSAYTASCLQSPVFQSLKSDSLSTCAACSVQHSSVLSVKRTLTYIIPSSKACSAQSTILPWRPGYCFPGLSKALVVGFSAAFPFHRLASPSDAGATTACVRFLFPPGLDLRCFVARAFFLAARFFLACSSS